MSQISPQLHGIISITAVDFNLSYSGMHYSSFESFGGNYLPKEDPDLGSWTPFALLVPKRKSTSPYSVLLIHVYYSYRFIEFGGVGFDDRLLTTLCS